MARIFDKYDPSYSVYNLALTNGEMDSDPELRSVAINIRSDHRVTVDREREFRMFFAGDLKKALDDYFELRVKKSPQYIDPLCGNLVADFSGYCCPGFDPIEPLCTVLNVNALRSSLRDADNIIPRGVLAVWDDMRDIDVSDALQRNDVFDQWLDRHFLGKRTSSPAVAEVISAFFSLLNYEFDVNGKKYKPILWSTHWNLFEPFTNEKRLDGSRNINRWNEVLGVYRHQPVWQLVLEYPASVTSSLYRPTQLDSGYYPQHFPPPREAFFAVGGHTVDLKFRSASLLPEYIHAPIRLETRYWNRLCLLGKTRRIKPRYGLVKPRKKHYQKLKSVYDPRRLRLIEAWMSRAV
jgi:hypothetical protein